MPNILCSVSLDPSELKYVIALAALLDKTPDDVIRMAVEKFSSVCVPTHDKKNTSAA